MTQLSKYSVSTLLAALLLTAVMSCSKDENTIITIDEIEIKDTLVLGVDVLSTTAAFKNNGLYTNCNFVGNSYSHALAFAEDLVIKEDEALYTKPLSVLFWNTEGPLTVGKMLTEGFIVIPDGSNEIEYEALFDLEVTKVDAGYIQGHFSLRTFIGIDLSAEFTIPKTPCEVFDFDEEIFGEYLNGRAKVRQNGQDELFMAASGNCDYDNIGLPDFEGQFNFTLVGLNFEIDAQKELTLDQEFIHHALVTDFETDLEIGRTYTAKYLPVTSSFFDENATLADMAQALTNATDFEIEYQSIDEEFIVGQYAGQLPNGLTLNGEFRATTFACQ